ncbi:MAG: hypothetical protein ACKOSR_14800 [Flavobacteriales bacterium]
MKINLALLLWVLPISLFAQEDKEPIYNQFRKMSGVWEGFMEYTDDRDNTTIYSLPAKCQSDFDGIKWRYTVQYDHGQGEITGGKGECTINDYGNKMNYDGVLWEIKSINEHGDTTDIIIETQGREKRKATDLRRTITTTAVGFFITEEVRTAETAPNYIVRSRHLFRRPARSKS